MRRSFGRVILGMGVLGLVVGMSATAGMGCLNDRETEKSEKEYKSRYEGSRKAQSGIVKVEEENKPKVNQAEAYQEQAKYAMGLAAVAGGGLLIGGAVMLTFWKMSR